MLKQETQVIDDLQFTTIQFPAMRAFGLLGRLVKTIGPAISALSGADPEADVATLAPAIALALKDIDPDAATALAADVLSMTSVIMGQNLTLNTETTINLVFTGRLPTMFKVLAFAVRVNFGDFFAGSVPSGALPTTSA